MLQSGAAITDWCLGLTTLVCANTLGRWRAQTRAAAPRWESCLRWAWLCETFACGVGGFTWAWGTNLLPASQLKLVDYALVEGVVLGMAGEGAFLAASGVALDPAADTKTAARWRRGAVALCKGVAVYEIICLALIYRQAVIGAVALLPAMAPLLGQLPVLWACRRPRDDGVHRGLLAAGAALNLAGILVICALDNDCAGATAITENAFWEDSPPRFATSQGASCPLPAHFNHAAVMHTTNILGNGMILAGLARGADYAVAKPDVPEARSVAAGGARRRAKRPVD